LLFFKLLERSSCPFGHFYYATNEKLDGFTGALSRFRPNTVWLGFDCCLVSSTILVMGGRFTNNRSNQPSVPGSGYVSSGGRVDVVWVGRSTDLFLDFGFRHSELSGWRVPN
jgi:hypothetical protein